MRVSIVISSILVALAGPLGCTEAQLQTVMQADDAARVATVTAEAIASGQLYCSVAGRLYQAGAVTVTNATAASVANVCAVLHIAGEVVAARPVPAAPGQTVLVAEVNQVAAAAVTDSVLPR